MWDRRFSKRVTPLRSGKVKTYSGSVLTVSDYNFVLVPVYVFWWGNGQVIGGLLPSRKVGGSRLPDDPRRIDAKFLHRRDQKVTAAVLTDCAD
jgi:hypothetical protein